MKKTYGDIIAEIEGRGIMPKEAPSLHRMHRALERLKLPIDPHRVVIVAGTNGKGSTCATLEALLISAGKKVGLYTSPHLVDTTERIRVGGAPISREDFCKIFDYVESRTSDLKLSHFEVLTAMAVVYFFSLEFAKVDFVILEVGLGGIWDATNAIPHFFCVITKLGFDHQNFLGDTIESIARNKFGVVSENSTVVYAPFGEYENKLRPQVESVREKTKSKWTESKIFPHEVVHTEGEPKYFLNSPWGKVKLSLPGKRGAENTSLALSAFEAMGFDASKHLSAIEKVCWPGRMQALKPGKTLNLHTRCPRIYLSGDHNPQGMESLVEILKDFSYKTLWLLVGIGKDKAADEMLEILNKIPDAKLILTETPFKGLRLEQYGEWIFRAEFTHAIPSRAFEFCLKNAGTEDLIVVTGSLYLVGKILCKTTPGEASYGSGFSQSLSL